MTGTARVSGTAWGWRRGERKDRDDKKKGTVDRQRQMSLFGISTKLQRERLAPSHCSVRDKWSECVHAPVPTWAFSLFPYSTPSSPAATGNQTISRREIKGPFSPSGTGKHGNSVWKMLPSSCKLLFPAGFFFLQRCQTQYPDEERHRKQTECL